MSRDIHSLTSNEIIGLIDNLILPYDGFNMDTIKVIYEDDHQPENIGNCNYRRIEIIDSNYEWSYICLVTLGFSKKVRITFVLS